MRFRRFFANNQLLRAIFFPIMRNLLNFEIKWKHDITGRPLFLRAWLHKHYWYYGSKREKEELSLFKQLIRSGDCVFEVGGHIGYVSQIFEQIVGESGSVFVAEPTKVSRSFLKKNVSENTVVLKQAISDTIGELDFYTEDYGGFTNSLVSDFTQKADNRLRKSQKGESSISKVTVPTTSIDAVCDEYKIQPNFLKIDVEGAELQVLRGAEKALNSVRALMVEVSRNHSEVHKLLLNYGFKAMNKRGIEIENTIEGGNIFFYK